MRRQTRLLMGIVTVLLCAALSGCDKLEKLAEKLSGLEESTPAPPKPTQAIEPDSAVEKALEPPKPIVTTISYGEKIYRDFCFRCHDLGIAGAVNIYDKPALAALAEKKPEELYQIVRDGKGIMPVAGGILAKEGEDADEMLKAAVDWMLSQSENSP